MGMTRIGLRWSGQPTHQRTPEDDRAQRLILGPGLGVMQHVSATDEDLFAQRLLISKGRPVIGKRWSRQTAFNYVTAAITMIATLILATH